MTAALMARIVHQAIEYGELMLTAGEALALDHELARSPHAAIVTGPAHPSAPGRMLVLSHVPRRILPTV